MADDLIVIQKAYDLTAWAVPAIGKFPRSHRFVLGERMENAVRAMNNGSRRFRS
jgi:hypothetical protein